MEELNDVDWKRLQSNPRLALIACLDILQGVAALHAINVAHCDIKAGAVMTRRRHRREDRGGGAGDEDEDERFVLYDFNLAVVNADEFDYSRVPFGSGGWSLRSHRNIRASAKDHDCFSTGLLIATSCCASAREIVEENGDMCYRDSLTHLIETARVDNDRIRHGILEAAFSLCLLDISIHDALQKLQTLRAREEQPHEQASSPARTDLADIHGGQILGPSEN
jgi:serine/threonine protein kinase